MPRECEGDCRDPGNEAINGLTPGQNKARCPSTCMLRPDHRPGQPHPPSNATTSKNSNAPPIQIRIGPKPKQPAKTKNKPTKKVSGENFMVRVSLEWIGEVMKARKEVEPRGPVTTFPRAVLQDGSAQEFDE